MCVCVCVLLLVFFFVFFLAKHKGSMFVSIQTLLALSLIHLLHALGSLTYDRDVGEQLTKWTDGGSVVKNSPLT